MSSRRKSGGRGSGGRDGDRETTVSKALSWILRHGAQKEGLELDSAGYANVEELLKWRKLQSLGVTFEEIQTIVAENDKQRFSLIRVPVYPTAIEADAKLDEDDPLAWRGRSAQLPVESDAAAWLIRANQGHSIVIESATLLQPLTLGFPDLPETALHGTYYGAWLPIMQSGGMSKMGRNHMHFAAGVPGVDPGVISGMRADAQILIYIDIKRALEAGLPFWRSDNGVILTEGDSDGMLPMEFFTKVLDRKRNVVLWEDGKEVAELPQALKDKPVPRGKATGTRGGKGPGKNRSRDYDTGDREGIEGEV